MIKIAKELQCKLDFLNADATFFSCLEETTSKMHVIVFYKQSDILNIHLLH